MGNSKNDDADVILQSYPLLTRMYMYISACCKLQLQELQGEHDERANILNPPTSNDKIDRFDRTQARLV